MATCWALMVRSCRAPSTWSPTATVNGRDVVPGTIESVLTTTWSIDFSISDVPQKGASYLNMTAGGKGMVLNLLQPSEPTMTKIAQPEHGGRGIRTPKSLRTPVFKTGAIAILPAL